MSPSHFSATLLYYRYESCAQLLLFIATTNHSSTISFFLTFPRNTLTHIHELQKQTTGCSDGSSCGAAAGCCRWQLRYNVPLMMFWMAISGSLYISCLYRYDCIQATYGSDKCSFYTVLIDLRRQYEQGWLFLHQSFVFSKLFLL